MGIKGFVTIPLIEEIEAEKPDIIFACGPRPMLKAVAEIAMENDIECQVSLEERMGCGVGACLVCSCKAIRNGQEIHAMFVRMVLYLMQGNLVMADLSVNIAGVEFKIRYPCIGNLWIWQRIWTLLSSIKAEALRQRERLLRAWEICAKNC